MILMFWSQVKIQITAKKISQKYKKIRDAKRIKILGEIPETIETKNGNKIEVVVPPSKILTQKAAKKIKEKYNKIRRNKIKSKKIVDSNKKNKILKNINEVDKIKTDSDKKKNKNNSAKNIEKIQKYEEAQENLSSK